MNMSLLGWVGRKYTIKKRSWSKTTSPSIPKGTLMPLKKHGGKVTE
jgi:hypothetical protein